MSDKKRPRDEGMTLPELLISVVLTGLLVASMSMSVTVMFRQSDNTEGRANNARSEQNVNVWMPTDLASAEGVDTDPGASPCAPDCPAGVEIGGTNALMLTWTGTVPGPGGVAVPTVTKVSYRYVLVGTEYQMVRVECVSVDGASPTCQINTVLHDLDPPPIGVTYIEGQTAPTWIMVVSQALDPLDTTGSTPAPVDDPTFKSKNGQRVVVTINGGGDAAGAGGGQNQISLSAGGTERETELATNSVSFNQSLTAARTRCGGNFGLLVDTSGSISSSDMATGRTAMAGTGGLIDTFAGTPVKLQVTKFSYRGEDLGADATGSRYFDMLKENDVADLKAYISGGTLSTGGSATAIAPGGSTNWEDALYRMFRYSDGTIQANLPAKVIFFTDGVPTYDRLVGGSQPGTTALPAAVQHPDDSGLSAPNGSSYNQRTWNRANRVAREFGVQVDFIGVFVGDATDANSNWTDVNAGYHLIDWLRWYHNVYERGYHNIYERGNMVVWERGVNAVYERNNNVVYERSGSGLSYQRKSGSNWSSISSSTYLSNNSTPDSTDNYRVTITGSFGSWTSMTRTQYEKTNTTADSTDGFRTRVNGSLSSGWTAVTSAQYNGSNTTSDSSDGWRSSGASYAPPYTGWESTTQATYDANNTTADESDGWRTRQTSSSTAWTSVSEAEYNASNTTSDSSDGWRISPAYSEPYSLWASTTQSTYNSNNTTPDESDGWRLTQSYTSPFNTSEPTDEATYIANKTAGIDPTSSSDGWSATKVYEPPYTGYDATRTYSKTNRDILGDLIDPSGIVDPIKDVNGSVVNAEVANMYQSTQWSDVQGALKAIALGQCGGTLTIQTRVGGSTPANDTFTYMNTLDNTKVETSGSKRSGTFDFAIPTGQSVTATIQQQLVSSLSHYAPAGWSCKAGGVALTPTIIDVPDTPWDSLQLDISANQAISCIQNVTWVG